MVLWIRALLPLAAMVLAIMAASGCEPGGQAGSQAVRIAGVHHRLADGGIIEYTGVIPRLDAALRRQPGRVLGGDGAEQPVAAELWFQEQVSEGRRELYLQAQVEVPGALRSTLGPTIHATVILEREREDAPWPLEDDVVAAAQRAFAVLDTRLSLGAREHAAAKELLVAEDPELVLLALEWLRERPRTSFSPALVDLLAHRDPRVATLAVECLGHLGDPAAVAPMIRSARLSDREHTRELYRALARLGGDEALGYLRFAAANEDDSLLREEAERSLRLALTGIPAEAAAPRGVVGGLARGHRQ